MDADDLNRRAKDRLPRGLVPVYEAALTVCFKTGISGALGDRECNQAADMLTRLCTLYYVSKDKHIVRALSAEEIRGGAFVESCRYMIFTDARPRLERLFVTRTALKGALAAIMYTQTPTPKE